MKKEEKLEAIKLRRRGMAIGEIAKEIGVSKGSVSSWVKDVELTKTQKQSLTQRGFSKGAIEKRRKTRTSKTKKKHLATFEGAKNEIKNLSKEELWLLGVVLYWGEGTKSFKGNVSLTNSDPAIIKIMMRFFREILNVPEEKFRCHIHTFSHQNVKISEQYWSGITGISVKQFYKTYTKPSIASKSKKDSLPYGTASIYISDTKLFWTIMGWIEGLKPKDMCNIPKQLL